MASPYGFGAGVARAIRLVETALAKVGPPITVRRQFVHNGHIVRRQERLGAGWLGDRNAAPDNNVVIFSAHAPPRRAKARKYPSESLVADGIAVLLARYVIESEESIVTSEDVSFNRPRALAI